MEVGGNQIVVWRAEIHYGSENPNGTTSTEWVEVIPLRAGLALLYMILLWLSLNYPQTPLHASKVMASENLSSSLHEKFGIRLYPHLDRQALSQDISALFVQIECEPESGVAPLNVTCLSTISAGFPPYQYFWDLGDGSNSKHANWTHLYETPSAYVIMLTVTDANGNRGGALANVDVVASLTATVILGTTADNDPLGVNFTAVVSGGNPPYNLLWEFGDGANSTAESPSHVYKEPGIYNITLIVTDFVGRNVTKTVLALTPLPSFSSSLEMRPWIILSVAALVALVSAGLVVRRLRKGRRRGFPDEDDVEDSEQGLGGTVIPLLTLRGVGAL